MDWKSSLDALRSSLPEGEEPRQEEPVSDVSKKGRLKIFYEKKGRNGKPCTIIDGFADEAQGAEAARELKRRLGVGGSARDTEVLLQGDQRQTLASLLKAMGYSC